jgi:hypothetical protein
MFEQDTARVDAGAIFKLDPDLEEHDRADWLKFSLRKSGVGGCSHGIDAQR